MELLRSRNLKKPLSENELKELSSILNQFNLSVSYLHGYLCSVISAPSIDKPSQWQQGLYNNIDFESMEQASKIIELMLRYHNDVIDQLIKGLFKPFLYKGENSALEEIDLIQKWSEGYLDGIDIDPYWSRLEEEDKEMQKLLVPLLIGAGYLDIENEGKDPELITRIRENKQYLLEDLSEINKFFYQLWNKAKHEAVQVYNKKSIFNSPSANRMQGRNELCACGSGKKFKKCCLN